MKMINLWARLGIKCLPMITIAMSILSAVPQETLAMPLAGTVIGNQASATYTDASNAQRTATSNTVKTIIQPVAGFTLTVSQDKYTTPGGTVYFGHTLTNTGNSVDTFALTAVDANTGTNIPLTGVTLYADANGDGLPDNFTAITSTTAIPAGGLFKFVVAATVPSTAVAGNNDSITVKGASGIDASFKTNTDGIWVTGAAVISLTKSESVATGGVGTAITGTTIKYTLTYTNTGNATATNVTLKDALDVNLGYKASTGRWSVTGATVLTDASGGLPQGVGTTIDYYTYVAGGTTNIWAKINSVPAGTSGTLSFDVYAATDPGAAANHIIPNTGTVTYNDGVGATPITTTSNRVDFVVTPSAATVGVVLYDTGSTTDSTVAPSIAVANDDIVDVYSATQGATVVFDNVVKNTGGATDTFNIEPYSNAPTYANTFPAGTSFLFFKADGTSPLLDTNGDGVLDTGPMAAGASYHVFVKAILPTTALGSNGGAGYKFPLVAISTTVNTVSDPTTDRLTTITTSTVDLTNNAAKGSPGALGVGVNANKTAASTAGAITTATINPGDTYTFVLYVNNTSTIPDSYDLLGSIGTAAFGNVSNVPNGWTLDFRSSTSGVCATTGQSITNTGTINAGASKLVCAVVTTTATTPAGTTNLYFRAKSPTSGALDVKLDAITVNTLRSIKITTNNAGQVFPGGSIVYTHIITNAGNVAEGEVAAATAGKSIVALSLADSLAPTWTSIIYWDKNNDGVLDANDPVVTDLSTLTGGTNGASTAAGLNPGETATLFVKVFAPLGAAINAIDTATITATTTGVIATVAAPAAVSNTDNTTVIAGQVRLVKTQALDASCTSNAAALTFATTDVQAKPGQCIMYKITATNAGSAAITTLKVSDTTPAYTTYYDRTGPVLATDSIAVGCAAGVATGNAKTTGVTGVVTPATVVGACGQSATITSNMGTLTPQQSATLTFSVRINP